MDKRTRTWLIVLSVLLPVFTLFGVLLPLSGSVSEFGSQAAGDPFQAPAFKVPDDGWTGRDTDNQIVYNGTTGVITNDADTALDLDLPFAEFQSNDTWIGTGTDARWEFDSAGNEITATAGAAYLKVFEDALGETLRFGDSASEGTDLGLSIILGRDMTIEGGASFANTVIGYGHTVNASSVTCMGANHLCGTAADESCNSSVILGSTNVCSSSLSFVAGHQNTVDGGQSMIGGGEDNITDDAAEFSVIAGGEYNEASASHTSIPGGTYADATHYGEFAHAAGRFVVTGDAQHIVLVARRQATHGSAAWYTLFLDGVDDLMTVPAESAWTFELKIVGITSNAGAQWSYLINGIIERDAANNTTLAASNVTTLFESDANFDVQVVADNVNEALLVQVQDAGSSGVTVRWVTTVDIVQVTY